MLIRSMLWMTQDEPSCHESVGTLCLLWWSFARVMIGLAEVHLCFSLSLYKLVAVEVEGCCLLTVEQFFQGAAVVTTKYSK